MREANVEGYQRALFFAVDVLERTVLKFGTEATYEHFMADLAEAAARELPPGTHFLRNACTIADLAQTERETLHAACRVSVCETQG